MSSTLLLLVFLTGPVSAFAEPPAASEARAVESFGLLGWIWEWVASLAGDEGSSNSGGGHLSGSEGGLFIDPNGNS